MNPARSPHWDTGGCTTTIAAGAGSRIHHTLDRERDAYKDVSTQRTMVERINRQAEALDSIHPKLRGGRAMANRNTLTYGLNQPAHAGAHPQPRDGDTAGG